MQLGSGRGPPKEDWLLGKGGVSLPEKSLPISQSWGFGLLGFPSLPRSSQGCTTTSSKLFSEFP